MWNPRVTSPLLYWGTRTPDRVALECEGEQLTWRELAESVEALADRFHQNGLRAGDRIGYLADNCVEIVQTILAAGALDAIAVPLNMRLTVGELSWIVDDAGLSALLTDSANAEKAAALRDHPMRMYWAGSDPAGWAEPVFGDDLPRRLPLNRVAFAMSDRDPIALLCYTSGTTGRPKGAMLTHRNVLASAESFAKTEVCRLDDTSLLVLPLAFTGSVMATWAPAYYAGATMVIHRRFSAQRTLDELAGGRVTIFTAVPFVFEQLVLLPDFDAADLSAIRLAKAGGAPASDEVLARYAGRGIRLGQGYGMTESAGLGTSLPLDQFVTKRGSVGIPNYHIEIRIVDADGGDVPVGDIGEVWLRGPSIMAGYWGNPVATEESFTEGWLRTGDLATRDADNYLSIVGRSKDMLISGGINVYPSEIERVISPFDGVTEVAVVGVVDAIWGEVPVAVIVSDRTDFDLIGLADLCRAELADFKRPKRVILIAEPLPRTMSGKVSKQLIREQLLST